MNNTFKQTLRKLLTGLSMPQEYICLDRRQFTQPFRIYLSHPGATAFTDVTSQHLFLGYKPLLIGLFTTDNDITMHQEGKQDVSLNFHLDAFKSDSQWHGFPASRDSVARLSIRKVDQLAPDANTKLTLYQGMRGEHRFLRSFHQFVGGVREKFIKRNPGNVSLENNLYDQVRIAYAVPRNISLISISDEQGKMNLFPTDLHGPIGEQFYAGSLRIEGKANQQVERFRRIIISQVAADAYQEVYALGKNHMNDLREESCFDLHVSRSENFGFPLPSSMRQYRELELHHSIDVGIHRIHIYQTIYQSPAAPESELSHIHMHYAQWRINHHLPTQMLFR